MINSFILIQFKLNKKGDVKRSSIKRVAHTHKEKDMLIENLKRVYDIFNVSNDIFRRKNKKGKYVYYQIIDLINPKDYILFTSFDGSSVKYPLLYANDSDTFFIAIKAFGPKLESLLFHISMFDTLWAKDTIMGSYSDISYRRKPDIPLRVGILSAFVDNNEITIFNDNDENRKRNLIRMDMNHIREIMRELEMEIMGCKGKITSYNDMILFINKYMRDKSYIDDKNLDARGLKNLINSKYASFVSDSLNNKPNNEE